VKDFDAIVTFSLGGASRDIALEYERTAKSSRHYRRIVNVLRHESKVHDILYLVPTSELVSFLLHCLSGARQRVWVSLAQPLCQTPAEAPLFAVSSIQPKSLLELVSGSSS
jgi:hypothetical protein